MKKSKFEGLAYCVLVSFSLLTPFLIGLAIAYVLFTPATFETIKDIGVGIGAMLAFPMPWLLASSETSSGLFSTSSWIASFFYKKEMA